MLQQEKKLKTTLPAPYFYPIFYGQVPVIESASNNPATNTTNNVSLSDITVNTNKMNSIF
jgi:hypothetical protein